MKIFMVAFCADKKATFSPTKRQLTKRLLVAFSSVAFEPVYQNLRCTMKGGGWGYTLLTLLRCYTRHWHSVSRSSEDNGVGERWESMMSSIDADCNYIKEL